MVNDRIRGRRSNYWLVGLTQQSNTPKPIENDLPDVVFARFGVSAVRQRSRGDDQTRTFVKIYGTTYTFRTTAA